jgi:tetratricopeptide (TPR) repeat protein
VRLLRVLLIALALLAVSATAAAAAGTSPTPASAAPHTTDQSAIDAARAKVAAGDAAGAIAGLEPYVASHPDDVAAGRLLGDLYFRIPDYGKAKKIWTAIVAAHPDDRETHNRLGSLYAVQDRTDDAIAEFQKSLPSVRGYAGLVMAHTRAGDLAQYVAKIERQVQESPLDLRAWSTLGQIRRLLHDSEGARDAFAHVVAMQPRSCDAQVDLANALVDLGRVDEAMTHLKACLAVDRQYYPAVVNMGEAYLEKRDATTARPYFDRALTLRPDGSEALVDIGFIFDMKGDWKSAVAYYTRAMIADPFRPEAYIDLGYDYNEHHLYPLAEAAFLKGISVSDDDGRLHFLLGVTYNVQGKIALARQQYKRAIESKEPAVVRAAQRELALLPPA